MSVGTTDLSAEQFQAVSELLHDVCGINLHRGKHELVRARLSSRLRELQLDDFGSYFDMVAADPSGRELARLIDVLTTNKTSFFREPRHFDVLRQRVVPELHSPGQPLRVWSAGCSSGEEPYSLAMVLDAELGGRADVRILATDISARMLSLARAGSYPEDAVQSVPAEYRRTAFRCTGAPPHRAWVVRERLRSSVRFAQLNLAAEWPMRGPFALICCRNVMIYFTRAMQQRLIERFWTMLVPGGYLFAGHSESLAGLDHGFEYVQPAVYRRAA
jgi:chemotaxis protein methyltransferase CheR